MSVLCNSLSEMPRCLSIESNPDDLLLYCLKDVVLSHSCLFMLFGWSGTANISHDISRFSILNHTYADNMESSDNSDQGTCATKRSTEYLAIMLLRWSSDCINSAISHQHWPHYTGSLSIAGRFQDIITDLHSPQWSSPGWCCRFPTALRSIPVAALVWQATPSQPPCRLTSYADCTFCCAAPVVRSNFPQSVKTTKTGDSFKVKLKTYFHSVSFA